MVVQISYRDDGSHEKFEFEFLGGMYPISAESLSPMVSKLYRQFDEPVTALNCAHAVGPLLEAMTKAGWTVAPPDRSRSDIAHAATRSASGRS
jgi:hypothetical protein